MPTIHSAKMKPASLNGANEWRTSPMGAGLRPQPMARAIALMLAAGGAIGTAQAQTAFSGAWFAAKGAAQSTATSTGRLPSGMPIPSTDAASQLSAQRTAQSITSLGAAAQSIAALQAAQAAARVAAQAAPGTVPDGLAAGGLKIDTGSLTKGWLNADAPVQTLSNGQTSVAIRQTADKAILNWETFNVGKHTTVAFQQQPDWAVLNRINDPNARPSQIQGQIKGDGTVLLVNRNGIVFGGTSQVNTRNLVAAAAAIADSQFTANGLYGAIPTSASFTGANGKVEMQAGAQIAAVAPQSVTQGGGYVLLMGSAVQNAGSIATPNGQTQLAAGDSFIIRKGAGTDGNTYSTTRGNEIAPQFAAGSLAGSVGNSGLILSPQGDITLAGRTVRQDGVAVATTSVNTRGTIHLLNAAGDALGQVTLGPTATTAVLLEQNGATALDSQRDALIQDSAAQDLLRVTTAAGAFDNLSLLSDRRDQSRIEVVSGRDVEFQGGSMTLATGGQIAVSAARRAFVASGANLDVAGAVGVNVAMESNIIKVNVQGNELRDASPNRDAARLANSDVWVDRRALVFVPKGTDDYGKDRWYTAGGLLEVGGYLDNTGHTIGEWAALGGTVMLGGREVVTQRGSLVNLSGGTLNVQDGYVGQSWLRGADGQLYDVSRAPGDMLYLGLYKGFEDLHVRWGDTATGRFSSPLIAPARRFEAGYTVGRDAGQLRVLAPTAVLEGDLVSEVSQGSRQSLARPTDVPAWQLGQDVVARRAGLTVRSSANWPVAGGTPSLPSATNVRIGDALPGVTQGLGGAADALPAERTGTVWLDADKLNRMELGGLSISTAGAIDVSGAVQFAQGAEVALVATLIDVRAKLRAPSGNITLSNIDRTAGALVLGRDAKPMIRLQDGASLDVAGRWVDLMQDPAGAAGLAGIGGGSVKIESTGSIDLQHGSIVDVSSGGALMADGRQRAGKGGDLYLGAGLPAGGSNGLGTLVLAGQIRAVGGAGGGTLAMDTQGVVRIADTPLLADGVLGAGQKAPFDLLLAADVVMPAGTIMNQPFTFQLSKLAPGKPLLAAGLRPIVSAAAPIPTAADWVIPAGTLVRVSTSPAFFTGGKTVPAGSLITLFTPMPKGYVLPTNVFPNGVPITPADITLAAGVPLPQDIVLQKAGSPIAAGSVSDKTLQVQAPVHVQPALFQSGFSNYAINAATGVHVEDGVRVDVKMPVYRFRTDQQGVPSGAAPSQALEAWTPPLHTENADKAVLTQRAGASLSLTSRRTVNGALGSGGTITVGQDAALSVDPGQSIALNSAGQITIEGALSAPGGAITVELAPVDPTANLAPVPDGRSIWIGSTARLDAAARAAVARDVRGLPYGVVPNGGSIYLGGDRRQGWGAEGFIIVRPGAVLDVSGAQARIVTPGVAGASAARDVASAGGSIALASFDGIYQDGTLRGAAGGTGAAAGSLSLKLMTHVFQADGLSAGLVQKLMAPREIVVGQSAGGAALPSGLLPGSADSALAYGHARLDLDGFAAGGFDALALLADLIGFDGNISLSAGRSIQLDALAMASVGTSNRVAISAPYVRLGGRSLIEAQSAGNNQQGAPELQPLVVPPLGRGRQLYRRCRPDRHHRTGPTGTGRRQWRAHSVRTDQHPYGQSSSPR